MPQTLVSKLRTIESASHYVDIASEYLKSASELLKTDDQPKHNIVFNKKEIMRKVLDEYRANHPLVDKAAKGDFLFSETIDEFAERYSHGKWLLPRLPNKRYDKRIDDLHLDSLFDVNPLRTELPISYPIFERAMNGFSKKFLNPVGLATIAGIISALIFHDAGRFQNPAINYVALAGSGYFIGGFLGFMASMTNRPYIYNVQANAEYLDFKIQEVYQNDRNTS